MPTVGASAFLGASLGRYLAVDEAGGGSGGEAGASGGQSSPPNPTPIAAWEAAMVNLGALSAMVGDHLTGPVLAAAEPGSRAGGSDGTARAGRPALAWPPSPATLACVAGVVAVGVGVAVAVRRSSGAGGGPRWRWPWRGGV